GLILMSKKIIGDPMSPFGLLDVEVERNAFGRQAESFRADIELKLEAKYPKTFPALFIRAPRICSCTTKVEVLGQWGEEAVFIKQGHHLGASFHPELTDNTAIHEYFINLVKSLKI